MTAAINCTVQLNAHKSIRVNDPWQRDTTNNVWCYKVHKKKQKQKKWKVAVILNNCIPGRHSGRATQILTTKFPAPVEYNSW